VLPSVGVLLVAAVAVAAAIPAALTVAITVPVTLAVTAGVAVGGRPAPLRFGQRHRGGEEDPAVRGQLLFIPPVFLSILIGFFLPFLRPLSDGRVRRHF